MHVDQQTIHVLLLNQTSSDIFLQHPCLQTFVCCWYWWWGEPFNSTLPLFSMCIFWNCVKLERFHTHVYLNTSDSQSPLKHVTTLWEGIPYLAWEVKFLRSLLPTIACRGRLVSQYHVPCTEVKLFGLLTNERNIKSNKKEIWEKAEVSKL